MSHTTEYAIEAMSSYSQAYVSNVSFLCPLCKKNSNTEVAVPEPDYSAEKTSDMVSDVIVWISCSDCDAEFEGHAYAGPSHCSIELTEYPDVLDLSRFSSASLSRLTHFSFKVCW